MVVDASAAAPFLPLDLETLGADVMVVGANAWGGPDVGAMVFRNPELLDRLPAVAPDAAPTRAVPSASRSATPRTPCSRAWWPRSTTWPTSTTAPAARAATAS